VANTSAIVDLANAKEYREMGNKTTDPVAKASFRAAATRLERRAARKANAIGRRRRSGSRKAPIA